MLYSSIDPRLTATQRPMLAQSIALTDVRGTVFVQPKFDGIRAVFCPQTQAFYTRNGKPLRSCDHLVQALRARGLNHEALDGEIYRHDLPFDVISGLARRQTASVETEQLQFHVFDRIHPSDTMQDRIAWLSGLVSCEHIKIVPTYSATRATVSEYYQMFLDSGFEGMIVRDPDDRYRPGSRTLGKIKPVQDMEAILVGFATSRSAQHRETFGALILQLASGKTFQCAGIEEDVRQQLWQTQPLGAPITVKYQELSPNGIPRFPRFKAIRHDL